MRPRGTRVHRRVRRHRAVVRAWNHGRTANRWSLPGLAMAQDQGHGLQGEERWRTASDRCSVDDADDGGAGTGPDAGTRARSRSGSSSWTTTRSSGADWRSSSRQEEDIQVVGEAGDGAEAVDKAADLLPDIVLMDVRMPQARRDRGVHLHQGGGAQRQDHHADDQRRGGRPLRRDQGGRDRLSPQGDLHRRGGHRDPRGGRRPVADQPVDGVEAADRVQVDDPAHRRAPAGARAAAHRPRAGGAQAGRHRA